MAARENPPPPAPPRLDAGTVLEPFEEPPDEDASLFERRIGGSALFENEAKSLAFERCRFDRAHAAQTTWKFLRLLDVEIDHADFANGRWAESSWRRVKVRHSRLTGLDAPESRIEDVVFEDSRIDLAFFHRSRFRRVRFERCVLTGAEFERADLTDVVFQDCELETARFTRARMRGADLRGSRVDGLVASADDLRGAIVEIGQLPALATVLGLDVRA